MDLVGPNCITLEDGEQVHRRIHPELLAGHRVELDFADVEVFASPFLNAAIGRLLQDIKREDLNRLLVIRHMSPSGMQVLKRVIENAKAYYTDPDLRRAVDAILTEQAGEE
jgi:hypothetical protein